MELISKYPGTTQYRYQIFKVSKYRIWLDGSFLMLFLVPVKFSTQTLKLFFLNVI